MRIIGYIQHPVLKITVFKTDSKLAVKFESGLLEQVYKFRTGQGLETINDIRNLVDEAFVRQVLEEMKTLNLIKNKAMSRFMPVDDEEPFDEIL